LETAASQKEAPNLTWSVRAWGALVSSLWRTAAFRSEEFFGKPCQDFVLSTCKRLRDGTVIKAMKYHTAYAFAYGTCQQELPTPPYENFEDKPGIWAGGWIYKELKRTFARARSGHRSAVLVCYDILMAKTGFPAVPDSIIKQSVLDHRKALSEPHETDDPDRRTRNRLRVKVALTSCIHKIFGGTKFSDVDVLVPSLSACVQNGRVSGGAFVDLYNQWVDNFFSDDAARFDFSPEEEDFFPPAITAKVTYDPTAGFTFYEAPNYSTLVRKFKNFVKYQAQRDLVEPCLASPCAIPEPLKCRVITRGDSARYAVASSLQKFIWNKISKVPIFKYTGQPIDEEDFSSVFGLLKEGERYYSGDYKASTDNIDPALTEYAWKCIADEVSFTEQGLNIKLSNSCWFDIGLQTLTRHTLLYSKKVVKPDGSKEYIEERVPQRWGQLMGSPMSFPILNLINYCATCVALGWDVTHFETNPVRTNGDDIGFIAPKDKYETWCTVLKDVGLERSLGKNYESTSFLVLNSELRFVSEDTRSITRTIKKGDTSEIIAETEPCAAWTLYGFLNQSILYGTSRKGIDAGKRLWCLWPGLAPLADALTRGINDIDQKKALFRAFLRCRDEVKTIPHHVSYFLPQALGGVGFDPSLSDKPKSLFATENELLTAAHLVTNHSLRLDRPSVKRELTLFAEILAESNAFTIRSPPIDIQESDHKSLPNVLVLGEGLSQLFRWCPLAFYNYEGRSFAHWFIRDNKMSKGPCGSITQHPNGELPDIPSWLASLGSDDGISPLIKKLLDDNNKVAKEWMTYFARHQECPCDTATRHPKRKGLPSSGRCLFVKHLKDFGETEILDLNKFTVATLAYNRKFNRWSGGLYKNKTLSPMGVDNALNFSESKTKVRYYDLPWEVDNIGFNRLVYPLPYRYQSGL